MHRPLRRLAKLPDLSRHQDLVFRLDRNQYGRHCTKAGWDMLVQLHREVAGMAVDMVLALAEGMETLAAGMGFVVDTGRGSAPVSGLRSWVEVGIDSGEDTGSDNRLVVVVVARSSVRENTGAEEDIALEVRIAADRKELVDGAEAGRRNNRCST
jgi:hypothetical protein